MEQELDYIAIGDRIRKYRELSRMTQEQLSESCSLSTGYIGHLARDTLTVLGNSCKDFSDSPGQSGRPGVRKNRDKQ